MNRCVCSDLLNVRKSGCPAEQFHLIFTNHVRHCDTKPNHIWTNGNWNHISLIVLIQGFIQIQFPALWNYRHVRLFYLRDVCYFRGIIPNLYVCYAAICYFHQTFAVPSSNWTTPPVLVYFCQEIRSLLITLWQATLYRVLAHIVVIDFTLGIHCWPMVIWWHRNHCCPTATTV